MPVERSMGTKTKATDSILVSLTIQSLRAHSLRIRGEREHGFSSEEVMEALESLTKAGLVERAGRTHYALTGAGREEAGTSAEKTGAWGRYLGTKP
jgi:Mn-dependent DtxR family transcriptional regulator